MTNKYRPYLFLIKATLIALLLTVIPAGIFSPVMPFWILLTYVHFMVRFNIKNPTILALPVGIMIDVANGDILGQNALSLMLSALFIFKVKQSFFFSNTTTQQVYLLFAATIYLVTLYAIHIISIKTFDINWLTLFSILTTSIFWPVIRYILRRYQ